MEFKEIEEKYWNSFYDKHEISYSSKRNLDYHDDFKKPIYSLPNEARILELACGVRCEGIEFALQGKKVYETDISEVAVRKAQEIYRELGIENQGRFIRCDAEELPFEDNFFDAVLISAAFHHLPNMHRALEEMKRVVKSRGLVILGVEPNAWPYFTVYWLLKPAKKVIRKTNKKFFHSIADDSTHGFTKGQMVKMFSKAELEIVKIERAKYFSELYDSGISFLNKAFKLKLEPKEKTRFFLARLDSYLSKVPLLNLFSWHWSIISTKNVKL